ncbi:hypothetical protein K6119_04890 [Paracrocinitomix mangrovi]|uniref:metallophosphoesterase family protein n=1 Tax=Paracrocinitomix mangrovi TaxID=2862509 RepID=UPI001C8DBAF5|nr:hypothetical protein [Paracrocinitomix mangrovi]UKN02850.1 hypothetical protein K6119_04890 [Paracrocinitomix mangrovi]
MKQLLLIISIIAANTLVAQYVSPFNGLNVKEDSTGNYKFIISGHFYGGSANSSGYPTNTLLANIDWINSENPTMLVCLGDLFLDVRNDIPYYERSLFSKLNVPLINSVGNHDLSGDVYQENYGNTYGSFELNGDLHVILDTELDDGDINDDQLSMIQGISKNQYNNVFVYAHRTIWKSQYPEMEGIFEDNTQSLLANNFESDVYPLVKEISKHTSVYWFAGSLGDAPASFFYHQDGNIQFIATAIRGLKRDAFLLVDVKDGEATFTTHSLTGQDLEELTYYNVDFWQENVGKEPFNWRLLPLYIKQTVLSWSFFFGALSASLFIGFIYLIRKKRKARIKP